jgi:hypothetical protein
MRYLREWTNEKGKAASAFEDEVTQIDVTPRLVTLTSQQGQLIVRAQFTRAELQWILSELEYDQEWTRRLAQVQRPASGIFERLLAMLRTRN